MLQPDGEQELVWRALGEGFENTTEMKRTYMTVRGDFLQGNVIRIMFCDVVFGQFYGSEVL